MAKTYFDTGALVKLYILEPSSAWVQRRAKAASSIPLNQLQETELRNAVYAAAGRHVLSAPAAQRALAHLDADIRQGVLALELPPWPAVWQRAAHLARLHTPRMLCRTLDVLHVAAAEACGADLVVTGDQRQFRLCQALGIPAARVPVS